MWAETGAALPFVVTPFVWQTWWFRVSVLVLCVGIFSAIERIVSSRKLREKMARLEQEVTQLRSTAQREMAAEAERLKAITQSDIEKVKLAAKAEM